MFIDRRHVQQYADYWRGRYLSIPAALLSLLLIRLFVWR